MTNRSDVDVVIVGAGAAGIGAAKTLAQRGHSFKVVEASHRVGGRAYSEETAPGEPFDLGCHWLHSASINPFREIAQQLGFSYVKESWGRQMFHTGRWLSDEDDRAQERYEAEVYETMRREAEVGKDVSIYDCMDRDSPWSEVLDYWFSLETSADPDQVSNLDLTNYNDTDEDWPVREGYGALMAKFAADVPVELNCAVQKIDWRGCGTKVQTRKGTLSSTGVVVTVSNGVLGAGDIDFQPALPAWKLDAIAQVPLGNHNRICLIFKGNPLADIPQGSFSYAAPGADNLSLQIRPFGYNQVIGVTGGRFATWLERAGEDASVDYVLERLAHVVGHDVKRDLVSHKVTAWGTDPWVKGAYSAARPGHHHQRLALREPVAERVYFAGEATSDGFWATAHGAYLSGVQAANKLADSLLTAS